MSDLPPNLSIATEKICFLIVKAREFDVKDAVTDPDDASNATDDGMISVLEDHGDDPSGEEIRGLIGAMNEDEQIDLVALSWLGRGDGTISDWDEIRGQAAQAHNKRTAAYFYCVINAIGLQVVGASTDSMDIARGISRARR
jgi:hypothetical protein